MANSPFKVNSGLKANGTITAPNAVIGPSLVTNPNGSLGINVSYPTPTAVFQANGDVQIEGTVRAKAFAISDGSSTTIPSNALTDMKIGCGNLVIMTDENYNWVNWTEQMIGDCSFDAQVRMEIKVYSPKEINSFYLVMSGRNYENLKSKKVPIHKGSIDTVKLLYA